MRLQGKLLNHKNGDEHEFVNASGRLTVEIDAHRFPDGVPIDQNTVVELLGQYDKEIIGESTLEVKEIKVVSR